MTIYRFSNSTGDADAALEIFGKWHSDILISDIGMLGVDGNKLIRINAEAEYQRWP